jgi:hypothetical protein
MTENQKGAWSLAGIAALCVYAFVSHQPKDTVPEFDKSKNAYTFGEYVCKDDCSGHVAGYAWAQEHHIYADDDCGGKSQSFMEGCKQWVKEVTDAEELAAEQDQTPD